MYDYYKKMCYKMSAKIFPESLYSSPKPETDYVLYFDGCSKGNPGPGGAGAVLYYKGQEIWGASKFVGIRSTNNSAEYGGLILGLQEAIVREIRELTVRGDSQLVIKQMRGEYQVKSQKLLELHQSAKSLAEYFKNISYEHVYRDKNKRADELSNMALMK
jgi:ribonuclease HI